MVDASTIEVRVSSKQQPYAKSNQQQQPLNMTIHLPAIFVIAVVSAAVAVRSRELVYKPAALVYKPMGLKIED